MRFSLTLPLLLSLAVACRTRPEGSSQPPAASLHNTRWVPRQLAGKPVTVHENVPEPYLLLRPEGSAEGNAGCNRFRSSATVQAPDQLSFSTLMSTKMACPAMTTEQAFGHVLSQTRRYRIGGDTLHLLDESGREIARLQAVYLK